VDDVISIIYSAIVDVTLRCMDDRLTPFYVQNNDYNANIKHIPIYPFELNTIPYIGNGIFGLQIEQVSARVPSDETYPQSSCFFF
jgi:hypothetical protein